MIIYLWKNLALYNYQGLYNYSGGQSKTLQNNQFIYLFNNGGNAGGLEDVLLSESFRGDDIGDCERDSEFCLKNKRGISKYRQIHSHNIYDLGNDMYYI